MTKSITEKIKQLSLDQLRKIVVEDCADALIKIREAVVLFDYLKRGWQDTFKPKESWSSKLKQYDLNKKKLERVGMPVELIEAQYRKALYGKLDKDEFEKVMEAYII